MPDNAEPPGSLQGGPRPAVRRISHTRPVWSPARLFQVVRSTGLEAQAIEGLLPAILVGGALGACAVISCALWIGLGGPARSPAALPTALVVTVTPTLIVPTPIPTPSTPPTSTPEGLYVGGYAQVSGTQGDALRLRSDPGLQTTTLKTVPDGARLLILDGPRDAEGFTWWRLRDPSDGAEGWGAQLYLIPASGQ